MFHDKDFEYFEKMAHWSFDEYDCHTESLTDWDLYEILKSARNCLPISPTALRSSARTTRLTWSRQPARTL